MKNSSLFLQPVTSDSGQDSITRIRRELFAYAVTLCRSRHDAEDLVQLASMRAIEAKRTSSNPATLKPWMCRVIRNAYIDGFRRNKVRTEHQQQVLIDEACSASSAAAEHEFNRVLVLQALGALDEDKREIIYFIDVAGFSYTEVAEILTIPTGTVMSRVSRARKEMLAFIMSSKPSSRHKRKPRAA